ncbi:hypothetical protein KP509_26G040100 [Ceratopteris richardii]|uniref:Adhesin domain-containing protein n=1 Tax=Ceratopteris richardii TaxID=49495 RepID=A0A8T2RMR5_CERRI|nr:hypothetical protein KP509_26G040100 [Ceratopteris richardii]
MNGIIRSACSWSRIVRQTSSFCTKVSPSLCRKVDVQVGASLQLNLAQVNVDVDIYTTVDNFEQIEIKSLWKNSNDAPTIFPLVTQQNNCINVDVTTYEAKESLQKFDVVMPGRWCNLSLKGGKGHVTIQSMKEANLGVITNGGSVKLGEVRGNEASIDSKGGIVKASLVVLQISFFVAISL